MTFIVLTATLNISLPGVEGYRFDPQFNILKVLKIACEVADNRLPLKLSVELGLVESVSG